MQLLIQQPQSAHHRDGWITIQTLAALSPHEVGGVNIVIMSLVLSVETVRSADYYP